MKSVSWISFCYNYLNVNSIIHFFPASQKTTAPYQIMVKLRIFGSGMIGREVVIDGVRLGQPDGIRLIEVFPELSKTNLSLFGLEIEFTPTQNHVDLDTSDCIIEFDYSSHSVKFRPIKIEQEKNLDVWLTDYQDLNASIVLVNISEVDVKVSLSDRYNNLLINKSLISRSIWEEKLKFSKDCMLKSEGSVCGYIVLSELQSKQVISVRKL